MSIKHESRPHLFLGQIGYCLFTPENVNPDTARNPYPSVDHLIPKVARNKHKHLFTIPRQYTPGSPPVLVNIVDDPINQVSLCIECHKKIDHGDVGKLKIFRQFGLVGLIEALALYPRAEAPHLYRLQYFQWRTLFHLLSVAFTNAQDIPDHLQPTYRQAEDLVGRYLYRWERGQFDIRSQCPDELTERIVGSMGCGLGSIRLHDH